MRVGCWAAHLAHIVAVRPLRNGVIADYSMAEWILRHFIKKIVKYRFFAARG